MADPKKIPSERTLANRAARVVLNHAALDAITMATADGLFDLAKAVIEGAGVPDAAPYGEGLVEGGGVLAWVGSKRVGAFATGPELPFNRPRAAKLSKGVTVIGGYGFPGRFIEAGTTHEPARPFLTPALMERVPDAEEFIRAACKRHKVIGKQRAARGDVFRKATP